MLRIWLGEVKRAFSAHVSGWNWLCRVCLMALAKRGRTWSRLAPICLISLEMRSATSFPVLFCLTSTSPFRFGGRPKCSSPFHSRGISCAWLAGDTRICLLCKTNGTPVLHRLRAKTAAPLPATISPLPEARLFPHLASHVTLPPLRLKPFTLRTVIGLKNTTTRSPILAQDSTFVNFGVLRRDKPLPAKGVAAVGRRKQVVDV